ncbi:MAG TPA: hypothetical protein VK513_03770 [Terriglobales bacterium]|jgi:hypothetical protein|nr:hypothetical protein [Terriglobales bacterium]
MSETKSNGAAHPQWRQLCEAAVLELDPNKLLARIAEARTAVLYQIEDSLDSSQAERFALHDALDRLLILHDIAKRDLGEQKRDGAVS